MVSQTLMRRQGRPEEIAEAVVWLCSEATSFVTGHTMTPDGGYMAQLGIPKPNAQLRCLSDDLCD